QPQAGAGEGHCAVTADALSPAGRREQRQGAGMSRAIAWIFSLLVCAAAQAQPARPNIVFIMTDDAGYGDFGSYGAPDVRTPVLDRLARDGVRFTSFYSNGPSCTPTRAGLL